MLLSYRTKLKFGFLFLALLLAGITANAQKAERARPVWWFGESGAVNLNYYRGTTQMLNADFTTPSAFHKGTGVKPYFSILAEYRKSKVWGIMMNVAFDNRGGKFETVEAPCNCPADLTTNLSYVAIEPALRIAPFSGAFYVFLGPTLGINVRKDFVYTQEKQTDVRGEWSNTLNTVVSGQAGAGIDIPLSARNSETQITLSPFASFQTDFGQAPRSVETWAIHTWRAGLALKMGKAHVEPIAVITPAPVEIIPPVAVVVTDNVSFVVKAPFTVPAKRDVKETFPIRNYVFFDEGSSAIPTRYVLLTKDQAVGFKESQFQQPAPKDLEGRSERQLTAYYNILNILGDRMRANPSSTVVLIGSSAGKGPAVGKEYAESVKNYLVVVFAIAPTRITTEGRDKPAIPSEQPGGDKFLAELRAGDRRVDIVSESLILEAPVQIRTTMQDPQESRIMFMTETGTKEPLKTWSLEVTDDKGNVQNFGPYTNGQESISGNIILGDRNDGRYKVVMTGETKDGVQIRKETTLFLMRNEKPKQESLRFSILFDFNKSIAVDTYEKFLEETVAPLVPNYATVIIHGHTDIIGSDDYNMKLSQDRANDAKTLLENATNKAGKKGVDYVVTGYGSDTKEAPFDNKFPEERFYNRTVIIDIVPNK